MAETKIVGSGQEAVISPNSFPLIVGERINPTNRKELAADIKEGRFDLLCQEALKQKEAGAHALDINVSVPGIDEAAAMKKAVELVQKEIDLPLVVDSTNPEVLRTALGAAKGRVMINSVNGKEESLNAILPLVVEYKVAVVGLTMGDQGIAHTAEKKLEIATVIVERGASIGIPADSFVIDCLALSVGTNQAEVLETLRAIQMIEEKLGVNTILGVSNISFGMPYRSLLNAAFVAMAIGQGLDALIVDPLDSMMRESVQAAAVLANRDEYGMQYITAFRGKK